MTTIDIDDAFDIKAPSQPPVSFINTAKFTSNKLRPLTGRTRVEPSQPNIPPGKILVAPSGHVIIPNITPLHAATSTNRPQCEDDSTKSDSALHETASNGKRCKYLAWTIGNILISTLAVALAVIIPIIILINQQESLNYAALCLDTACENEGTCYVGPDGSSCVCLPGYTGSMCETDENECLSSPCENGGICTQGINTYNCTCPYRFDGDRCHIESLNYDALCLNTTCENGATCYLGPDGSSCVCLPGYTGSLCETDENECLSSPCENGGTCTQGINTYNCTCPYRFGGDRCNIALVGCGADIVIILDRSGSMGGYVSNNRAYMNAIAQNLTIGQCDVLVSVLFVYQTPSLMWDFGSSYTNSSVNLVNAFNSLSTFNSISNEASGSYLSLGPALDYARTTLLPGGRATAADVVIMFWDGDNNLAAEAALLHSTARVLSVSTTVRTGNVQSIVTSLDDMFYSNTNSSASFINRLQSII